MRLLQVDENGDFILIDDLIDSIPPYAILSHTWGEYHQEVSFKDLTIGPRRAISGYKNLRFCSEHATRDGLQHFWVDTCCTIQSTSDNSLRAVVKTLSFSGDGAYLETNRGLLRCRVQVPSDTVAVSGTTIFPSLFINE
jgi:hypothetical protein